MNEAVFKVWPTVPVRSHPTPSFRGDHAARPPLAPGWFVWRKLERLFLQRVVVNVTSVVDSWGQGSGMWGHKGEWWAWVQAYLL